MLTILFFILMIWVFWKLVKLSVKAAWGISKILLTLVLLPIILVVLVIAGFIYIAIPILAIVGVIALVSGVNKS